MVGIKSSGIRETVGFNVRGQPVSSHLNIVPIILRSGRMAVFKGTSNLDRFIGNNNIMDEFRFAAPDLQAGDHVQGGIGPDYLILTTAGVVSSDAFDQIAGVEWIFLSDGGNSIALPDRFAQSADLAGQINVVGGNLSDVVDASAFAATS